jgi:excisionase family DNA binding protein
MQKAGEKHLLRVPEACSRLGIGRTQLYRMIRDGVIPAVRVGATERGIRLRPEDLDEWALQARRWGSPKRRQPPPNQ